VSAQRFILQLLLLATYLYGSAQTFEYYTFFDADSSKIKEVFSLNESDSLPNGTYLSFFEDGNKRIEGYYVNGQPSQLWTYYFENGEKKSSGYIKDGIANGKWEYYYESGGVRAKGVLNGAKKIGYWTNYFENGNEKSSGTYFADQKEGIWNYFFEDGSLKAQAYFEEGKGNYKEFYPGGTVKMEGPNLNGKSDGDWRYYYESGELLATGSFVKGLRDGLWDYYHKNGNLSGSGLYREGKKEGQWTYYHPNGEKSAEGKITKDEKDGQWSLYYETGEVRAVGTYNQGDGIYTEYYPNGRQKAKGEILNGKRQGRWVYFNEDGVLDGEADYDQDIGTYTGYYSNQKIKMQGPMEGEKRVGEWRLFDTNSNLAGVYRPIYEEAKPVFRFDNSSVDKNRSEKPEYVYKTSTNRHFTKVINEYRGLIYGTNPLMVLLDELPVAMEYYLQERLGYEIQAIYHRDPFFSVPEDLGFNDVYSRGISLRFKQKFYQPEGGLGMFYFGHQLGITRLNHKAEAQDQRTLPFQRLSLEVNETLAYYGLFVGLRWLKNGQKPGFTIDSFVGADVGVRNWEELYDTTNNEFTNVFRSFTQSSLYLPIRFGVHIGFTKRLKTKTK